MSVDYVKICLDYGITESIMLRYLNSAFLLCEEDNKPNEIADEKYRKYVANCEKNGIKPLNKESYQQKKSDIKDKLIKTTAVLGTVAASSAVLNHTSKGRELKNNILDRKAKINYKWKKDKSSDKRKAFFRKLKYGK